MKLDDALDIEQELGREGLDCRLDQTYSGRGMYGKETAALIVDNDHDVVRVAGKLGINTSFRVDNMGRRVVVY